MSILWGVWRTQVITSGALGNHLPIHFIRLNLSKQDAMPDSIASNQSVPGHAKVFGDQAE